MGDNAEHRDGPQPASSGAVSHPLTQGDVKAARANFDGRSLE